MTPSRAPGRSTTRPLLLLAVGLAVASCGGSGVEIEALEREVVASYSEIVFASYQDALTGVRELRERIRFFVQAPSEASLEAARASWLAAREPYGQTEAYRFYGGPIDDADGPGPMIHAWPIDEGHLDYVAGAPASGIVNDVERYPTIDRGTLIGAHTAGNVAVGFHAIEFLLWGQDTSAAGPGARSYEDYVDGVRDNASRRGAYLTIAADLLVDHMEEVLSAWTPDDPTSYRSALTLGPTDIALERILVGIAVLSRSELAGGHILAAYDSQSQEDERSRFSDNTHRDIALNALGVANVFRGEYTRTDGTVVGGVGFDELLAAVSPRIGAELSSMIGRSLAAVAEIPVPFDRAIVERGSRPLVLEAVYALQEQGDKIVEVGAELGLRFDTALPD